MVNGMHLFLHFFSPPPAHCLTPHHPYTDCGVSWCNSSSGTADVELGQGIVPATFPLPGNRSIMLVRQHRASVAYFLFCIMCNGRHLLHFLLVARRPANQIISFGGEKQIYALLPIPSPPMQNAKAWPTLIWRITAARGVV